MADVLCLSYVSVHMALLITSRVIGRFYKLGVQNWQFRNLWMFNFSREITIEIITINMYSLQLPYYQRHGLISSID